MKERVQMITMEVSDRYRAREIFCDQQVMKTFNILKSLMDFFQCYHDNQHEEALEVLAKMKLVPLNMSELDICVQNFKKYVFN